MDRLRSVAFLLLLVPQITVCLFAYNRHLYNGDDVDGTRTHLTYDEMQDVVKRDSKGTCTCTCETKPVRSGSADSDEQPVTAGIQHKPLEKHVPQSASLLRTAAMLKPNSGSIVKPKSEPAAAPPPVEAKPQNVAAAASASHGSKVGQPEPASPIGIVRIPPMDEYAYDRSSEDTNKDLEDEELSQEEEEKAREDNWNYNSPYPWRQLPDTMCFREMCQTDRDCCLRFNICDRSAHVCVDCWYGSSCTSDKDCCLKYPYCLREWKTTPDGKRHAVGGKCSNER